jgi:hypothetical protein
MEQLKSRNKGKDKPLSWDYATEMKTIKKDSLYELTTTFETGYNFTEIKFMVNDSLEFDNEENRRVVFLQRHTFFMAKFNKLINICLNSTEQPKNCQ